MLKFHLEWTFKFAAGSVDPRDGPYEAMLDINYWTLPVLLSIKNNMMTSG